MPYKPELDRDINPILTEEDYKVIAKLQKYFLSDSLIKLHMKIKENPPLIWAFEKPDLIQHLQVLLKTAIYDSALIDDAFKLIKKMDHHIDRKDHYIEHLRVQLYHCENAMPMKKVTSDMFRM